MGGLSEFMGSLRAPSVLIRFLGAVHILRNTLWGAGVFPIYYNINLPNLPNTTESTVKGADYLK